LGYPIIKEDVLRSGKKQTIDLVAYVIDGKGNLIPQVVVDIYEDPPVHAPVYLQGAARSLDVPYALLITREREVWYDQNLLPVSPPNTVYSCSQYITDITQIQRIYWRCYHTFRGVLDSENTLALLAYNMLLRHDLKQKGNLEGWSSIQSPKVYIQLLEETMNTYHLIDQNLLLALKGFTSTETESLVRKTEHIIPTHYNLGFVLIQLVEKVLHPKMQIGEVITTPALSELFQQTIQVVFDQGRMLDLSLGSGFNLFRCLQVIKPTICEAIEVNHKAAELAQILFIVTGLYDRVTIYQMNSLEYKSTENYDLILLNPPLGQRIRSDALNYNEFAVTEYGRRRRVDLSELLLEQAIQLAKPGGMILTLLTEGLLFKNPVTTRDYIRKETIIEGIFSLPPHTLRPYTAVKTSLLVLKKKLDHTEIGKEVFLAEPKSLEDFTVVVDLFAKWRKGEKVG
jgi:methylase of polypeptide subunit release factors